MTNKDLTNLIGEYAHPVQTVIQVDHTIAEALEMIRKKYVGEKIIYFYVVDKENRLIGVVPTRKLLMKDLSLRVADVMETSIICLNKSQTLQEALEILESHKLLALPVVDEERHLLGVIDVDIYLEESLDVAQARRRFDIFQIIGMTIEEGKKLTPWIGYRSRMPWIFCNMIGGFSCAIISRFFELVLEQVILLAMFIPLVLTLSESISMQSMTQSMQLIKRQSRKFQYTLQFLIREWKIVALLSISCGIIVGAVSLLWGDGVLPGLVITVSIMASVYITSTIGSAVPLILHARKWDPKVAAGPVVLMFADVLTTLIYLSLGTWLLLK
ncbi:MAG: magnesium transporter [Simkaniaceae bacterium]|nr:magnesium transporter [Simkaniaceae bacterium]